MGGHSEAVPYYLVKDNCVIIRCICLHNYVTGAAFRVNICGARREDGQHINSWI